MSPSLRRLRVLVFAGVAVLGLAACERHAPRSAPVEITTDANALCVGSGFACFVTGSGEVRCSGRNLDGQLGDGSHADHAKPIAASGLSHVTRIACGDAHVCAVASGRLHCWGRNDRGQLGVGDRDARATPTEVAGLENVVAVAAGSDFSCAATVDGRVRCMGAHDDGRLGVSRDVDALAPVQVSGATHAAELVAGRGHVCALDAQGAVRCWGLGTSGQLGDGRRASRAVPRTVSNLGRVTAIGAGGTTTCAVSDGRVRCFGNGDAGQLVDGPVSAGHSSARPHEIAALAGVANVSVGSASVCARGRDGAVSCWGDGRRGELGHGRFEGSPQPVRVRGVADARALAVGDGTACVVRANRALACWGDDAFGAFGNGGTLPSAEAIDAVVDVDRAPLDDPRPALGARMVPGRATPMVALGDVHLCALTKEGAIRCTGDASGGRLGHGTTAFPADAEAVSVLDVDDALELAAQAATTCARRASGRVACWGQSDGSLGYPGVRASSTPIEVFGIVDASDVAVGRGFACMVRGGGAVACLGDNALGQLGVGSTSPTPGTQSVVGLSDAVEIAAGRGFACARRTGGQVVCWGDGSAGQLGDGQRHVMASPVAVSNLRDAIALSAFDSDACAIRRNGRLVCWGRSAAGAYVDPTEDAPHATSPIDVAGMPEVVRVAVGAGFACAVGRDGSIRCFGRNARGQAGAPPSETPTVREPRAVLAEASNDADTIVALTAGQDAACAVRSSGIVLCWGGGDALGRSATFDGDASSTPTPVVMRGLRH